MGGDPNTYWIAISSVATAITAILITITLIVQAIQTNSLRNQTLFANFSIITDYTGDPETRKNRRIIYKFYRSPLMNQLLKSYPNHKGKELHILAESLKQISAMYERVGFLLAQNRDLKKKFLDYHGFTMAAMWKIFEPLNTVDITNAKSKGYTYFNKIGDEFYTIWKSEIDAFLAEKEIQNKNREDAEIISEPSRPNN